MKRGKREELLNFRIGFGQRREITHRPTIIAVMQVDGPRARARIGSELKERSVKIVSGHPGMRPGTGNHKQAMDRIVGNHTPVFSMMSRTSCDSRPKCLCVGTQGHRQGGDIAIKDGSVRFQGLRSNLPFDERV